MEILHVVTILFLHWMQPEYHLLVKLKITFGLHTVIYAPHMPRFLHH